MQTPVIAYHLGPAQRARFAEHWSKPRLIDPAPDRPAWLPPAEADALFTFTAAWKTAPAEPPPGWPFGLRWVQMASAGVDALPPWVFRGPVVAGARGITAPPIAEYVLAVMLDDERRLGTLYVRSRQEFLRVGDEKAWRGDPFGTLAGRVLGLVGLGAIGQEIARRAHVFGMRVMGVRRSQGPPPLPFIELRADLEALMAETDHLVVCAPLTPATVRIINAASLAAAKPGLHLINVARGPLVDHDALLAALDAGRLRKATLDVTDPEPLPEGHRLYTHPAVRLTPHIAWYSGTHFDRLAAQLLANLDRYARGEPLADVVDPAAGY